MSFDDLVRSSIALANSLTASLQSTVKHYVRLGDDGTGSISYSAPVDVPAIVTIKTIQLMTTGGQIVEPRASILFLTPRLVKTQDKIVLPDGSTGPILDVQGMIDPDTNIPYAPKVYLG